MYSFVVYLYVGGSGSITSFGEGRELICLLLFTCNYVVSVWRGFLFLCVLGMGYVVFLWHSLSLAYTGNYFDMLLDCVLLKPLLDSLKFSIPGLRSSTKPRLHDYSSEFVVIAYILP